MSQVFGVDSLYFSVDFKNYRDLFNVYYALKDRKENEFEDNNCFLLGGHYVGITGYGFKHYDVGIKNEGFEIFVTNKVDLDSFPVYVRLSSKFLWQVGVRKAYRSVVAMLHKAFGAIHDTKCSRVDLACHTDEFDIDKILGYEVTRARSVRCYYDKPQRALSGVYFGKGSCMLRIYDKSFEVDKSNGGKAYFWNIWARHGLNPTSVVNVEFQIRREFLKEFKAGDCRLNSVDEVLSCLDEIWSYLTVNWFSLKDKQGGSNVSRDCEDIEQWVQVRDVAGDVVLQLDREKMRNDEVQPLLAQAKGLLTAICAKKNIPITESLEVLLSDPEELKSEIGKKKSKLIGGIV